MLHHGMIYMMSEHDSYCITSGSEALCYFGINLPRILRVWSGHVTVFILLGRFIEAHACMNAALSFEFSAEYPIMFPSAEKGKRNRCAKIRTRHSLFPLWMDTLVN